MIFGAQLQNSCQLLLDKYLNQLNSNMLSGFFTCAGFDVVIAVALQGIVLVVFV